MFAFLEVCVIKTGLNVLALSLHRCKACKPRFRGVRARFWDYKFREDILSARWFLLGGLQIRVFWLRYTINNSMLHLSFANLIRKILFAYYYHLFRYTIAHLDFY